MKIPEHFRCIGVSGNHVYHRSSQSKYRVEWMRGGYRRGTEYWWGLPEVLGGDEDNISDNTTAIMIDMATGEIILRCGDTFQLEVVVAAEDAERREVEAKVCLA